MEGTERAREKEGEEERDREREQSSFPKKEKKNQINMRHYARH